MTSNQKGWAMKVLHETYKKIPLLIHYTATRTSDKNNPFDVEIEKIVVRGTVHDIYDIMREQDLEELRDIVVSAELDNGFEKYEMMREDKE